MTDDTPPGLSWT